MLLGGDFICFILGLWLGLTARYLTVPGWQQIDKHLGPFFLLFLFWVVIIFINGLYDLGQLRGKTYSRRFLETAIVALLFGVIFFYIFPQQGISPKTVLLLNVALGFTLSYCWRMVYNHFINTHALKTNVLFVGYTPETEELIKILENYPEQGYKITALIDPEKKITAANYPFLNIYDNLKGVNVVIKNHKVQMSIIAPHLKKDDKILRALYQLLFSKIKVMDLTSFYEVITGRVPPSTFSEAWFLENVKNQSHPIYEKIRAAIDLVLGIMMLIIFAISFPLVALAIKLISPGPIFFKQKRVGQWGKEFTIYKFRSMLALSPDGSAETGGFEFAKKNDKRITWIGKLLRKTRLDELPQCFNLLKRNITIIGPRPERPEIVREMEARMPYYSLRHIVKPGLTGWAVIHQNYTDTLETTLQKLQYDIFYIKNRSLLLDLTILLRTINVVMRMRGQ